MEENKKKISQVENKKQVNKKKILILVITLIIVIAIIAFSSSKLNKKPKNESKKEEKSQQISQNNTLIDYTNTENVVIEGEKKINNSTSLLKEKHINGMAVKEITLYALNGQTNFTATIENNSTTEYGGGIIQIVFLNADGSEYGKLQGNLPGIAVGGRNKINASTTSDLTNAYDFKIEF